MSEYKAVIKDAKLAKEVCDATSLYQDQLIASLNHAKQSGNEDDFKRLKQTVGHVLATLGSSILFPIYRQHPSLTPELLKDIIAKEALTSDKSPPPPLTQPHD